MFINIFTVAYVFSVCRLKKRVPSRVVRKMLTGICSQSVKRLRQRPRFCMGITGFCSTSIYTELQCAMCALCYLPLKLYSSVHVFIVCCPLVNESQASKIHRYKLQMPGVYYK